MEEYDAEIEIDGRIDEVEGIFFIVKDNEQKKETMEELSIEIKGRGDVKGSMFIQRNKSDKAYLYERFDSEGNKDGYEVFRRKINKKFGCESYPGSKSFGIWAWCFNSIDKAMAKFEYINNKYEK